MEERGRERERKREEERERESEREREGERREGGGYLFREVIRHKTLLKSKEFHGGLSC